MASSLLFRIKSIFDNTGFREAEGGFKSVLGVVGKLGLAASKVAFSFRFLGAVLGFEVVKGLFNVGKGILTAVPAAAKAESSFVRLRTQLELLGLGSTTNIKQLTKFAQESSKALGFSSQQTQEAVAIALRRTGDVNKAIKQVSVSQNIAAATGRDLITVTQLLNVAQAGNTRVIRQITNLRQADIESAVKQGRLLDILADKFGGSAAKQAETLAGKLAILRANTGELQEEIGALGIPFAKFIADLKILGSTVVLNVVRGFKESADVVGTFKEGLASPTFLDRYVNAVRVSGSATLALGIALRAASKDSDDFNKKVSELTKPTFFDFDKQLEINTKRLGKSFEERRKLFDDQARAEELIEIVQRQGAETLNKEQIDFLQQFQFGNAALAKATRDLTDKQKAAEEERERARARIAAGLGPKVPGGVVTQIQDLQKVIQAAQGAGLSFKQVAEEVQRITGDTPKRAELITSAFIQANNAINIVNTTLKTTKANLDAFSVSASSGIGGAVSKELEAVAKAIIKPAFNIKIGFDIPPEAVKAAVAEAIRGSLPGLVSSLINSSRNAAREEVRKGTAI